MTLSIENTTAARDATVTPMHSGIKTCVTALSSCTERLSSTSSLRISGARRGPAAHFAVYEAKRCWEETFQKSRFAVALMSTLDCVWPKYPAVGCRQDEACKVVSPEGFYGLLNNSIDATFSPVEATKSAFKE